MYLSCRKRLQWSRVLFFVSGVLLCCIYQLSLRARLTEPWPEAQISENTEEELKTSTETTMLVGKESSRTVVENFIETATTKTAMEIAMETSTKTAMETTTKTATETTMEIATETGTETAAKATMETTTETATVTTTEATTQRTTELPTSTATNWTNLRHCIYVDSEPSKPTVAPTLTLLPNTTPPLPNTTLASPGNAPHMKGEYPEDIFSVEQRRQGWVVLHIFGMVYMFVSLAIVCDEFFVPALGVITDKLAISDDVAGATFMAAGGSAPELFTSLIGVFISHSNVGTGTIVGSAVFNLLFVIGMCALFSREMLHLTWWPLFRDVSFYILDLLMLMIFFLDSIIMWWESLMLVMSYCSYVLFMKYNAQLEQAFKEQLSKHQNIIKIFTVEEPEKDNGSRPAGDNKAENQQGKSNFLLRPPLQRGGSSASLHNSTMRSTILQLMIHTLDPLGEVRLKDKAEIMNDLAERKRARKEEEKKEETSSKPEPPAKEEEKPEPEEGEKAQEAAGSGAPGGSGGSSGSEGSDSSDDDDDDDDDSDEDSDEDDEDDADEEEKEEPLSLEWPDTRRKQATYLFLLPIVFPLWLTIPDVRNAASKKFFAISFLGSIMWIAVFSYLMVWWAHQVGETIGISEEIMGLTILAAGTSIPDLITSVIVARKGLGDMAVSSSVGSNIFDITVGLPVPWLLYSGINGLPVIVRSNGLFCTIVLLFFMLLFVILSIAFCKWKMNKVLGSSMFLLYFIFLVLSVLLEDRIIVCPVSI